MMNSSGKWDIHPWIISVSNERAYVANDAITSEIPIRNETTR